MHVVHTHIHRHTIKISQMLHYLIIIFTTITIQYLTDMIELVLSKIKANRAGHVYTCLQPSTEKVETEELL